MGHATHFLERLERVSMPQADFALALYRDSELVRFVLASVKLPDGVERVALALEHGPETPHVIVGRDGGFVTCLGKDMSVGDHVVVSRERLDRLSAEQHQIRQALARVKDTGNARQIFRRLYRCGPALPREDIRTLRAIYPLYWPELFHEAVALADRLQEFRARYRRTSYRRLSSAAREVLRRYWEASWALGHMVALHRHGDPRDGHAAHAEAADGGADGPLRLVARHPHDAVAPRQSRIRAPLDHASACRAKSPACHAFTSS